MSASTKSQFWKDHYTRLHLDTGLSETKKVDFSNDAVRFQTYAWLLEAAGPLNGRTCLDAGCGNGDVARLFAAMGGKVDAFDLVEPSIARLTKSDPQIRWFVGDIFDLSRSSIAPGYDRIVASEVLECVEHAPAIAALWRHVLPGGRLVAIAPNADCPIVARAVERFAGHYAGLRIADLLSTVAALPDVAWFGWRGARFAQDQTLVPYVLGPWSSADAVVGDPVPNRIQFALIRK